MRFLIFIALVVPISLYAQITITNSDLPAVNDVITRSIADTFIQVNPAPTGTNYTWDYSNLNAIAETVDTFLSLSAAPAAYNLFFFGAANRAVAFGGQQDLGQLQLSNGFQFYNTTNNGFYDAGFAGSVNGIPIPARYDQPDLIFQLPLTFPDTFSSSSTIDITIPNLVSYIRQVERSTEVDGYGTLYLPGDTFQVLRTKSIINQLDSIDLQGAPFPIGIPRQTIEYNWLAKGEKWPLLTISQINVLGAGVTTQVSYKGSLSTPVGLATPARNEWKLYPTLLGTGQHLQLTGNYKGRLHVQWINTMGQVVASQLTANPSFAAPALPAGHYWVQLWDDQQMKVVAVQLR